jgi:hypothetical protein
MQAHSQLFKRAEFINRRSGMDMLKAFYLSISAEKSKSMLLSRHQNAGQNHDIKMANWASVYVARSSNIWERL